MCPGKKKFVLTVCALSLLLLFLASSAAPENFASAQSSQGTGVSATTINISGVVNITAAPRFTLFSLNAEAQISSVFNLNFTGVTNGTSIGNAVLTSPTEIDIVVSFSVGEINPIAFANGSQSALPFQRLASQASGLRSYSVILPTGTQNASIFLQGTESGEYLLGRYVSNIPLVFLSSPSNLGVSVNSQTNLFLPEGSIVSAAYAPSTASESGPPESVGSSTSIGAGPGQVRYEIPPAVGVVVIQSKLFIPVAILFTALAVLLIVFTSLGFLSRGNRLIRGTYEKLVLSIRNAWSVAILRFHLQNATRRSFRLPWRQALRSKNLLVLFILCGVLMISFAAIAGPNPSVSVYVIAPPQEMGQIQSSLQAATPARIQIVTPSQDFTDFNVMSNIGMFKVLVVSDYPSPALAEVSKFVVPNANNVPIVAFTSSADPAFVSQLKAFYGGTVVNLSDTSDLSAAIGQARGANVLGLQISNSSFKVILIIESLLSFLLVLFGWAYLGAKAVEPSVEKSLVSIGALILSGVFVFYFSEVLYVVTSATLNFPLSLHAVISGADTITAVGILGAALHLPFGGGSTPRLLTGVIGVLIGGFGSSFGKTFSKRALGLIIGVVVVLIANPLVLGGYVFQGLLLFVGNASIGIAFTGALTLKGFLYGIGAALGGTISPVYLMSAGKMLYFAGLVPLAFVKKMPKGTATFTFLLAALIEGDGGVRVGEMSPDKTVIAVLPGLIAGVIFAILLLTIAWVERYLTTAYVRTRP